jgi:hypothetical protein
MITFELVTDVPFKATPFCVYAISAAYLPVLELPFLNCMNVPKFQGHLTVTPSELQFHSWKQDESQGAK